jgi:hypothetical protein
MAGEFSAEALLSFVEYAGNKGLMNKATAAARKAAVKRVSPILEPHEAQDVSKLDIDEVMRRFSNLEGSAFTPESLATYRSRFRATVEDFLTWKENPMAFRPARNGVTRRPSKVPKEDGRMPSAPSPTLPQSTQPPQTHSLPIPLRADLTVFVHGVPFDLTKAEARRIANVVIALAIEPDAEEQRTD